VRGLARAQRLQRLHQRPPLPEQHGACCFARWPRSPAGRQRPSVDGRSRARAGARAQALVATVRAAADSGRASAAALEPARIALFSLGNLAAHRECGEALAALGVHDLLARLLAAPPDEARPGCHPGTWCHRLSVAASAFACLSRSAGCAMSRGRPPSCPGAAHAAVACHQQISCWSACACPGGCLSLALASAHFLTL